MIATGEALMRAVFVAAVLLAAGSNLDVAKADFYPWCAMHGNGGDLGGIRSCYFMTEQQCRATLSGLGGLCIPNSFETPEPAAPRRARGHR